MLPPCFCCCLGAPPSPPLLLLSSSNESGSGISSTYPPSRAIANTTTVLPLPFPLFEPPLLKTKGIKSVTITCLLSYNLLNVKFLSSSSIIETYDGIVILLMAVLTTGFMGDVTAITSHPMDNNSSV